jgi:hypothetical protein
MSKKPSNKAPSNEPSHLTFHEIVSLLASPRCDGECVDEKPIPEQIIRALSNTLQKQGLMVVDADGLQHVVKEAFLDGWCKITKYLEKYGGSALKD